MLRFRKCSPGCGAAFEKLVLFPLQLGGAQAEVVEPVAQCDRRRLGGNGTNEAGGGVHPPVPGARAACFNKTNP